MTTVENPINTYNQTLLDAALGYAARAWHVFPLRPGTKKPAVPNHPAHLCDHTDPRCTEGHSGWESRATTDADRIKRAWTTTPYGIGIATGPSGLVVIDLDIPKTTGHLTGLQRLAHLEERAKQSLPPTFTVTTPSGGRHLYYTAPTGPALGNTASRLAPYIDTRANGGYIVAPPTQLDHRQTYELLADADPIPTLPAWIAAALNTQLHQAQAKRPTEPSHRPTQSTPAVDRYIEAAINGETSRIRQATDGTRNNTLFIAAVAIGQLVGADLLTLDDAHSQLLDAAHSHITAGAYDTGQAHKTITSGLNCGRNQPRQLPPTLQPMTIPIFKPTDWRTTADGVWEAQATPRTLTSRPPYEATCTHTPHTGTNSQPCWTYHLYTAASEYPTASLELIADGTTNTLHHAQTLTETNARRHRDRRLTTEPHGHRS